MSDSLLSPTSTPGNLIKFGSYIVIDAYPFLSKINNAYVEAVGTMRQRRWSTFFLYNRTQLFLQILAVFTVVVSATSAYSYRKNGPACRKCVCQKERKIVNCSGLGLTAIPQGIPRQTRVLYLDHNEITSVTIASRDLPSLEILHLEDNKITKVTPVPLPAIIELYLDRNEIATIAHDAFWNLLHLKILHLGYNKLSSLPPALLQNSRSVLTLHLEGNYFHQYHFPENTICSAVNFPKIENLCIRDSNLQELSANSFAGCSIDTLDLSYNDLTSIGDYQLEGVSDEPTRVDLSHNSIASISARSGLPNKTCTTPYLNLTHTNICLSSSETWVKEYSSCIIFLCANGSKNSILSAIMYSVVPFVSALSVIVAIACCRGRLVKRPQSPISDGTYVSFLATKLHTRDYESTTTTASFECSEKLDSFMINYRDLNIKKKIATGGYATVYKARLHGMTVAVKKLGRQFDEKTDIEDLVKEAGLLSKFHHANIVRLIAVCPEPNNLCLVTEFVRRGSLRTYLRARNVNVTWAEKLSMLHDAGNGMLYLHSRQPPVIHRDLKTSNLLVAKDGTVKVCDFGVSKCRPVIEFHMKRPRSLLGSLQISKYTENTKAPGTLRWTAPEMLTNDPKLTPKSDVYSFGMVLWEFASASCPPPDGAQARKEYLYPFPHLKWSYEVADAILSGTRPPIPSVCIQSIRDLIIECWQEDFRKRPYFKAILGKLAVMAIEQGGDLTDTSDGELFLSQEV